MKRSLVFLMSLFFACCAFSQAPDMIKYQAVARDQQGNIITTQIGLRITIEDANGTAHYTEVFTPTPTSNGIINLNIGGQIPGSLTNIPWDNGAFYIRTEMDPSGGSNYTVSGLSQLLSVPYALYANQAGSSLTGGTGAFSTTASVTSNSPGSIQVDDFVFGSSQLNNNSSADDDARFFFKKEFGAFRAGRADGNFWDTNSLGINSFASGFNTVASGLNSSALGNKTIAAGDNATAIGKETSAKSESAFASGESTIAAGEVSTSMGIGSITNSFAGFAIGRYNVGSGSPNTWILTDPIFEIGIGSDNLNRTNALTVLKNGNVGILTNSPNGVLDIAGQYWFPDTDGQPGQVLQTDGSGTLSWGTIIGGGNGAFATFNNVTSNSPGSLSSDDFVFGSDELDYNGNTQHASRFFFDKSKSAFRAGFSDNSNWDDNSIGNYSIAVGKSTIASGTISTAFGALSVASGSYSTAMGLSTVSSGRGSTTIGNEATASGDFSIAMGINTIAESYGSFAIGRYNTGGAIWGLGWNDLDPVFEIGIGTDASNRANALTVLKNGSIGIQTSLPSNNADLTLGNGVLSMNETVTPAADANYGKLYTKNDHSLYFQDGGGIEHNLLGAEFRTVANVTSNSPGDMSNNDFVFGSDELSYNGDPYNASRFYFDKSLGAFRAGHSNSYTWDSSSIGVFSFASGTNTVASGNISTAMGSGTKATAGISTAFGRSTSAEGNYSTSIGDQTIAKSLSSLAIGSFNVGFGDRANWIQTDPIFEIGIGTSTNNRLNALTVLKNGSVGIGTANPSINADLTLENGIINIKETTTPNADVDYGKIYTKNDNKLYFQDGDGVEHEIQMAGSVPTPHYIGENYGGGIVFYVYDNGQHGLIAATSDLPHTYYWNEDPNHITNAGNDYIRSGLSNSLLIMATYPRLPVAAVECVNYSNSTGNVQFGDWYLPSRYELDLMYQQKNVIGGFSNAFYWSSTARPIPQAYGQDFSSGQIIIKNRNDIGRARPIRAF